MSAPRSQPAARTRAGSHAGLARDPRLPQRDVLLDERAVASRLSATLGANGQLAITDCERVRTKYRAGDSLRVLHRVRVGGVSYTVAARAYAAGESLRAYERAAASAVDCAPLRGVLHDAELETVFWTFPNDRKLAALSALRDAAPGWARRLAPGWISSRVVAYAPEKCATAECLDPRSRVVAYAKVYAGDEGRRVYDTYRALARRLPTGDAEITIPRALAYDETHRTLLLAPAAGARIADLSDEELPRGYRRLGAALAALHNAPAPEGLQPFTRLDAGRLRRAARAIAGARPDVRREACDLADELERRRARHGAEPRVCLHGDVHSKNGILRGERLTLIDLDQCGTGHAAADLGSLLASLTYSRLTADAAYSPADATAHPSTHTQGGALADAFLSGYSSVRELPAPESLRWHTAAALLAERALRAVNRVRPEGLARLRELLREAAEILRKGGAR
ncbi:MAG TPA: phosphotransferase [Pyrinomonadaceae bacterium]|jgi:Ser/Thr protein kinase RdoA (MazF antagonist)